MYGVPIGGGVSPSAVGSLTAGYRVRKGTGAPDYPDPTQTNFPTSTTKFNDVGANDHTTYEEQISTDVNLEQAFIQALYVGSLATLASYTASLYYGNGSTISAKYWTGSAWSDWTGVTWAAHLGDGWEDGSKNPTDRSTQYILLTLDRISDGTGGFLRIGDFRIT